MKIRWSFLFFLLIAATGLYSQTVYEPFKATIGFGPAFPVGNFAGTSVDSGSQQSAAKPGPAINLSLSYQFRHSFFGVAVIAGWQQNSVNENGIAHELAALFPTGAQIAVKSGTWQIWKYLCGPVMNMPISSDGKTNFECGLAAGVLKTTIPSYSVGIAYSNQAQFFTVSKKSIPAAFCYQLNAGINYRMTPRLQLYGDVSFSHASPVDEITAYLDPPYYTMPVHITRNYPVSTVNLLVGVSYTFH